MEWEKTFDASHNITQESNKCVLKTEEIKEALANEEYKVWIYLANNIPINLKNDLKCFVEENFFGASPQENEWAFYSNKYYFILSDKENNIIGGAGINLYAQGKIWLVMFMAINKNYRWKWLGKYLMDTVISFLKENNIPIISLITKDYRLIKIIEYVANKYGYEIIKGKSSKEVALNKLKKLNIYPDELFPLYSDYWELDDNLVLREYVSNNPTGEPIEYDKATILKDLKVGERDGILFILVSNSA